MTKDSEKCKKRVRSRKIRALNTDRFSIYRAARQKRRVEKEKPKREVKKKKKNADGWHEGQGGKILTTPGDG